MSAADGAAPVAVPLLEVTVRVAASGRVGAGHAARTCALGSALRALGARLTWACDRETIPYLTDRGIPRAEIRELPAAATTSRAGEAELSEAEQEGDAAATLSLGRADWTVIDSYLLGAPWQHTMKAAGVRVLAFDDLLDRAVDCDIVVNAAANPDEYAVLAPGAMPLCGLRYALAGHSPLAHRDAGPVLLIAFGAADPANLTTATIRAIAASGFIRTVDAVKVHVQLGAAAAHRAEVESAVASYPWAMLLAGKPGSTGAARLAIGAAGVGLIERMQDGAPSVVLCAAHNQQRIMRAAIGAGAALEARSPEDAVALAARLWRDPAALQAMSAAGRTAVDGGGAARIARAMNRVQGVSLREASMADAAMLHAWRNHPAVRAVSHSQAKIPWEDHVRWLDGMLGRTDRRILVAVRSGRELGTVRLDVAGSVATVSITVDPVVIGSGLGPAMLDATAEWAAANLPGLDLLRAEIRDGNAASVRAFLAAGYRLVDTRAGMTEYSRPLREPTRS